MMKQLPRHFRTQIIVNEQHCWLWQGGKKPKGYGVYSTRKSGVKKTWNAHTCAYEVFSGQVPEGLELDHLCRQRACVNPCHLEPVTRTVNLYRGHGAIALKAAQTHCIHGHDFDAKNTYIRSNGTRECRACKKRRRREPYPLDGPVTPDFTRGGQTL